MTNEEHQEIGELVQALGAAEADGRINAWCIGVVAAGGCYVVVRRDDSKIEAFGESWPQVKENFLKAMIDEAREQGLSNRWGQS